ncbi:serine-rich adhesin for platelets-like [Ptychodera flava]|uniref:serine-rich adhesin for platelets-like n=1 Tax=Ptychodera flava TaxID=63121 RepID=UPI00396A10BE
MSSYRLLVFKNAQFPFITRRGEHHVILDDVTTKLFPECATPEFISDILTEKGVKTKNVSEIEAQALNRTRRMQGEQREYKVNATLVSINSLKRYYTYLRLRYDNMLQKCKVAVKHSRDRDLHGNTLIQTRSRKNGKTDAPVLIVLDDDDDEVESNQEKDLPNGNCNSLDRGQESVNVCKPAVSRASTKQGRDKISCKSLTETKKSIKEKSCVSSVEQRTTDPCEENNLPERNSAKSVGSLNEDVRNVINNINSQPRHEQAGNTQSPTSSAQEKTVSSQSDDNSIHQKKGETKTCMPDEQSMPGSVSNLLDEGNVQNGNHATLTDNNERMHESVNTDTGMSHPSCQLPQSNSQSTTSVVSDASNLRNNIVSVSISKETSVCEHETEDINGDTSPEKESAGKIISKDCGKSQVSSHVGSNQEEESVKVPASYQQNSSTNLSHSHGNVAKKNIQDITQTDSCGPTNGDAKFRSIQNHGQKHSLKGLDYVIKNSKKVKCVARVVLPKIDEVLKKENMNQQKDKGVPFTKTFAINKLDWSKLDSVKYQDLNDKSYKHESNARKSSCDSGVDLSETQDRTLSDLPSKSESKLEGIHDAVRYSPHAIHAVAKTLTTQRESKTKSLDRGHVQDVEPRKCNQDISEEHTDNPLDFSKKQGATTPVVKSISVEMCKGDNQEDVRRNQEYANADMEETDDTAKTTSDISQDMATNENEKNQTVAEKGLPTVESNILSKGRSENSQNNAENVTENCEDVGYDVSKYAPEISRKETKKINAFSLTSLKRKPETVNSALRNLRDFLGKWSKKNSREKASNKLISSSNESETQMVSLQNAKPNIENNLNVPEEMDQTDTMRHSTTLCEDSHFHPSSPVRSNAAPSSNSSIESNEQMSTEPNTVGVCNTPEKEHEIDEQVLDVKESVPPVADSPIKSSEQISRERSVESVNDKREKEHASNKTVLDAEESVPPVANSPIQSNEQTSTEPSMESDFDKPEKEHTSNKRIVHAEESAPSVVNSPIKSNEQISTEPSIEGDFDKPEKGHRSNISVLYSEESAPSVVNSPIESNEQISTEASTEGVHETNDKEDASGEQVLRTEENAPSVVTEVESTSHASKSMSQAASCAEMELPNVPRSESSAENDGDQEECTTTSHSVKDMAVSVDSTVQTTSVPASKEFNVETDNDMSTGKQLEETVEPPSTENTIATSKDSDGNENSRKTITDNEHAQNDTSDTPATIPKLFGIKVKRELLENQCNSKPKKRKVYVPTRSIDSVARILTEKQQNVKESHVSDSDRINKRKRKTTQRVVGIVDSAESQSNKRSKTDESGDSSIDDEQESIPDDRPTDSPGSETSQLDSDWEKLPVITLLSGERFVSSIDIHQALFTKQCTHKGFLRLLSTLDIAVNDEISEFSGKDKHMINVEHIKENMPRLRYMLDNNLGKLEDDQEEFESRNESTNDETSIQESNTSVIAKYGNPVSNISSKSHSVDNTWNTSGTATTWGYDDLGRQYIPQVDQHGFGQLSQSDGIVTNQSHGRRELLEPQPADRPSGSWPARAMHVPTNQAMTMHRYWNQLPRNNQGPLQHQYIPSMPPPNIDLMDRRYFQQEYDRLSTSQQTFPRLPPTVRDNQQHFPVSQPHQFALPGRHVASSALYSEAYPGQRPFRPNHPYPYFPPGKSLPTSKPSMPFNDRAPPNLQGRYSETLYRMQHTVPNVNHKPHSRGPELIHHRAENPAPGPVFRYPHAADNGVRPWQGNFYEDARRGNQQAHYPNHNPWPYRVPFHPRFPPHGRDTLYQDQHNFYAVQHSQPDHRIPDHKSHSAGPRVDQQLSKVNTDARQQSFEQSPGRKRHASDGLLIQAEKQPPPNRSCSEISMHQNHSESGIKIDFVCSLSTMVQGTGAKVGENESSMKDRIPVVDRSIHQQTNRGSVTAFDETTAVSDTTRKDRRDVDTSGHKESTKPDYIKNNPTLCSLLMNSDNESIWKSTTTRSLEAFSRNAVSEETNADVSVPTSNALRPIQSIEASTSNQSITQQTGSSAQNSLTSAFPTIDQRHVGKQLSSSGQNLNSPTYLEANGNNHTSVLHSKAFRRGAVESSGSVSVKSTSSAPSSDNTTGIRIDFVCSLREMIEDVKRKRANLSASMKTKSLSESGLPNVSASIKEVNREQQVGTGAENTTQQSTYVGPKISSVWSLSGGGQRDPVSSIQSGSPGFEQYTSTRMGTNPSHSSRMADVTETVSFVAMQQEPMQSNSLSVTSPQTASMWKPDGSYQRVAGQIVSSSQYDVQANTLALNSPATLSANMETGVPPLLNVAPGTAGHQQQSTAVNGHTFTMPGLTQSAQSLPVNSVISESSDTFAYSSQSAAGQMESYRWGNTAIHDNSMSSSTRPAVGKEITGSTVPGKVKFNEMLQETIAKCAAHIERSRRQKSKLHSRGNF